MKFSKHFNNKKCAPKIIFFNEKRYKDSDNFCHRKVTLKVRSFPFLTTFTQLTTWLKKILRGWLKILGLSEVILIFVHQIILCILPEKCLYFLDKIWSARPLCSSTYVLHSNRLGSFGVKAIRVMSFSFLVFSVRTATGSLISL